MRVMNGCVVHVLPLSFCPSSFKPQPVFCPLQLLAEMCKSSEIGASMRRARWADIEDTDLDVVWTPDASDHTDAGTAKHDQHWEDLDLRGIIKVRKTFLEMVKPGNSSSKRAASAPSRMQTPPQPARCKCPPGTTQCKHGLLGKCNKMQSASGCKFCHCFIADGGACKGSRRSTKKGSKRSQYLGEIPPMPAILA